tara:strand:- start:1909 stop:2115 length:207 start_codon:yes stop_codon:yes gene_type:complete
MRDKLKDILRTNPLYDDAIYEIMQLIETESPKPIGIMDVDFNYEVKEDDKMKYFARGVKLGIEISKEN